MQQEIILNSIATQSLQAWGLLTGFSDALFRPSGWKIPNDTDTGISFGEVIDVGGGYMEMDLQDVRPGASSRTYSLRGGYVEVGLGLGEISKLQGLINKIVKIIPLGARPSSDLVVLPGGGITQLIMGPLQFGRQLEINDFKLASWVYTHIGAEIAVGAGDIGFIYMVDKELAVRLLASVPSADATKIGMVLLASCVAWCPYWGLSVGLGAGGKIAVRIIQTVSLK
jgi:hypothetical protein